MPFFLKGFELEEEEFVEGEAEAGFLEGFGVFGKVNGANCFGVRH